MQLVLRPSSNQEQQRLHCPEMIYAAGSKPDAPPAQEVQAAQEGEYAWYLQGNEVGRGTSIFEGEIIRRYSIVWSSDSNPRWIGNDGSGQGKGFVDALREGDCILVWARAKVSFKMNDTKVLANYGYSDEGGRTMYTVSVSLPVLPYDPSVWRHHASII